MFSPWLGDDMPRDAFMRAHFQRMPLARAATARGALPLLTWATLESVLQSRADLLVVRDAKMLDVRPQTVEEALALFRDGWSLVLRHCERFDDGLRALADAVAAENEGDVTLHIFATPRGFHSFGWHYDCEDVLIVQTSGAKEYFLRENTVNPRPTLDAMPRDMQYERETSPAIASLLVAGDCLYIPRGWWHAARGVEPSLSLSIGVLSPDARGAR
jgi:50S ribosomal protein L16 3-hydroxylase